jgi:hypothetical protein
MADIFLSYAREDLARATPLVTVLEAHGWTVFWDPCILPGLPFRDVLAKELEAARCVIVLWSRWSVESAWVNDEAERATERGVLLSVLIDDVKPPLGLGQRQMANLVGWKNEPAAVHIGLLLRAIAERIGDSATIVLWPVDLNLVTGDQNRHGDLRPTINMTCKLSNNATQPVALKRLEIAVTRAGEPVFHLVWHLLYKVSGGEHARVTRDEGIVVAGKSIWESGVQFGESQADISNTWPAGTYEFELLGWVDRRPGLELPNLKTKFRADVDPLTEREMTHWTHASTEEWNRLRASNRALAFPIRITDVRPGL